MKAGGQKTTVQVIEKVGGRDRDRTGDPLLAKQTGQNTKRFVWCRLRGQSTRFPLSQMSRSCPELAPRGSAGSQTYRQFVRASNSCRPRISLVLLPMTVALSWRSPAPLASCRPDIAAA